MALNQADIVEKFGVNLTMEGSMLYDSWQWTDYNTWTGYLIESQINDVMEEVVDEDGNVVRPRLPRLDVGNPNITKAAPTEILT